MTLPFPTKIFSSYTIDFMGPFMKLKGYDTVLVRDRVEEYSDAGRVDKGFWDPHTDTKYDSAE